MVEFIIYTDHRSLAQLNEQRLHTIWQQKMYTKLVGLQYKIVYRKGVDNGAADALSRKVQEDSHCCAISHSVPTWLQEVVEGYDKDPTSKQLLAQLILNSVDKAPFSLHQGIIRHKNRIWLCGNLQLQQKVLQAMHDTAVGGHFGAPATYHKVKQMFYWPGCVLMCYSTFSLARYASNPSPIVLNILAYCSLWKFQHKRGIQFHWILLKVCPVQLPITASWWLWINFRSMDTSYLYSIPSQLLKWLVFFLTMCTSYTGYL